MKSIFIIVVIIILTLGVYWLYKKNQNKTDTLTDVSCTPYTIDERATDYKLNNKGECIITSCFQNFKTNDDMTKCVEMENFETEQDALLDFQTTIKSSLLSEAQNKIFVTEDEIENADIVAITNSFLNKCPTPGDVQTCIRDFSTYCTDCVNDVVEYCDNNPTDTSNPITGLDCDYIVDERLGDACMLGDGCDTILKKCKDDVCMYIPIENSSEECSQPGVTCTPIVRTCTQTSDKLKSYCL